MKNLLRLGQFLFVLILLLIAGSVVRSSVSDKLTIFTFSQPVELPGVTLPAGTYAFKLLDSIADRSIVQVFDKDQRKLFATILAIPDYTPQPSSKTIIKFSETTPGGPKAIKEWFYPGETIGWEFVYPKKRAMELAKDSNQSVPSMPNNLASNITQPAQSSSDSGVTAMEETPIKAEKPSGDEVEVAEVFIVAVPAADDATFHPTPHSVNTDADEVVARQLPKTASLMPLLWLSGFALMIVGAFLWMLSGRMASRRPA
jgi:hypothetical protein